MPKSKACVIVSVTKKKFLYKLCYYKIPLFYDKQLLFIMFLSTLIKSIGKVYRYIVSYLVEGLGMTVLKLTSFIDSRTISPGEVCGDEAPVSSENSFLKQCTLTCIVLYISLGKIPTLIKQLKLF